MKYKNPNVKCVWCNRKLKFWQDYATFVAWCCCCKLPKSEQYITFGVDVIRANNTVGYKILRTSILKDLSKGYLEISCYVEHDDKDAYWEICLGNTEKLDCLKSGKGEMSVEEAKKLLLKYEKLIVFI